jgi:hypothetical protein
VHRLSPHDRGAGAVLAQKPIKQAIGVSFHGLLLALMFFVCQAPGDPFQFHLWLAGAQAVPPTPVCILFSGVMIQSGLFAVAELIIACYRIIHDHWTRENALQEARADAGRRLTGAMESYILDFDPATLRPR